MRLPRCRKYIPIIIHVYFPTPEGERVCPNCDRVARWYE